MSQVSRVSSLLFSLWLTIAPFAAPKLGSYDTLAGSRVKQTCMSMYVHLVPFNGQTLKFQPIQALSCLVHVVMECLTFDLGTSWNFTSLTASKSSKIQGPSHSRHSLWSLLVSCLLPTKSNKCKWRSDVVVTWREKFSEKTARPTEASSAYARIGVSAVVKHQNMKLVPQNDDMFDRHFWE